jgi:sodium/hydrogen exchanger-like protein 6/7
MALGVTFGLGVSLVLKHSHLAAYHQIESCLVALAAYTCYFFSTGIALSGIVSLLFCGITLKHYAYHTMSRRTQRTTKSIFRTLAQLSENFIFVYLGLSLFTSPPSQERVGSYFKPLFVLVAAVAVVFTRYAAVFPLSELINFVLRHARGQRTEELPHAYQMMLFWAGLRGAVGVALAAGFQGPHAQTLRTTVLLVVVLTVVVFGGTTARMLEVLGIRTGVEDEPGSDSDDDPPHAPAWARRRAFDDRAKLGLPYGTQPVPPYGAQPGPSAYNHAALASPPGAGLGVPAASALFSAASSEYESDGEVLPLAPTRGSGELPRPASAPPPVPEDGQWFQQLDERYFLPLFSNATASRTWNARQAQRRASALAVSVGGSPEGSDDEDGVELDLTNRGRPGLTRSLSIPEQERRAERGLNSPVFRPGSGGGNPSNPASSP